MLDAESRYRSADPPDHPMTQKDVVGADGVGPIAVAQTGPDHRQDEKNDEHRPELLILDEPTTGLDPLVRKSVFDELRQFVERGHTVLFSSHTLSEVEELADEVIILRDGRVIEHELIGELRRRALRRVTIVFTTPQDVPQELPDNLTLIKRRNSTVEATWSGKIDRLISWLGGQSLADVTVEQPDLEDLFLTYYSDGKPATGESNE